MDPIRPKFTPPNLQGSTPAAEAPAKKAAEKTFDVGNTAPPAGSNTANQVQRPAYEALAGKIQEAASRSLTREQALSEVVSGETQRLFGSNASPALTEAVTQAFKNDPHLSALFNQLYNKATRQGG